MSFKTHIRSPYTTEDLATLETALLKAFTDDVAVMLTARQAWMAFEMMNHAAASGIVAAQMPNALREAFNGHFFHALSKAYDDVLPADWRDHTRPLDA